MPRELFVPEELRGRAYDDAALPIGSGQTISQPAMVALICELLALRGDERVLDVGTGSGYQAAVLAELAAEVHTIERLEELAAQARENLAAAGYADRVVVHVGDGTLGDPEHAPFAAIAVAAAAPGAAAHAVRAARAGRADGGTGRQQLRPAARARRPRRGRAEASSAPCRAASSRSSAGRVSTPTKRARVTIRGHVQGVGFRYSTGRRARSRNVSGWVRNNPTARSRPSSKARRRPSRR